MNTPSKLKKKVVKGWIEKREFWLDGIGLFTTNKEPPIKVEYIRATLTYEIPATTGIKGYHEGLDVPPQYE